MPKRNIIDTPEDIERIFECIRSIMDDRLEAIAYSGQKVCMEEDRHDGFHKARMRKFKAELQGLVVSYAKSWQELNLLRQHNRLTNDQRHRLNVIRSFEGDKASRSAAAPETDDGDVV